MEEYYVYIESTGEILSIVNSLEEAIKEKKYAWNKQGISAFIVDINKENNEIFE